MSIKVDILENLDQVSRKALDLFLDVHENSNNHFYIVPGGKTPSLFFTLLAEQIENWGNTQFIMSDERLTNNKKLSNSAMFEKVFKIKSRSNNTPALLKYNLNGTQSIIENKLKSLTPKMAILGLGPDGHTASLFPGNPEIFNDADDITIKTSNDWEDYFRISLTFNYLMKSKQIIFLVGGQSKAEALKECLVGNYNPIQYPAQYIFRNYVNDIHVLCDETASKYLA